MIEQDLIKLKENGYILKRKLINDDECNELINYLKEYKNFSSKDMEPNSNVPYIYDKITGDDSPFNKIIIEHKYIKDISEKYLNEEAKFYFLKVNNKSKWIGQDICYHQEFAVSQHYGLTKNDSVQIFMALEPHTIENGCLKIIEKSHKEGEIIHEDFFDTSFNHKLRVSYENMDNLYNKYGIKNCELQPGDCLIFNQFLVHGSHSNKSQDNRKAIVGWITRKSFENDNVKSKIFWQSRMQKTLIALEQKIEITKEKMRLESGMTMLKNKK